MIVTIIFFLLLLILIKYISPLLKDNYLSEYWNEGVPYLISAIIYLCFCLIYSISLIVIQLCFLMLWIFRLNDIGVNKYLCFFPFFYYVIFLFNNFFIFSSLVFYSYFILIFISGLPPTHYFKK